MEAAIEFKSESIQNRQDSLRASMQSLSRSEAEVLEKLVCLNITEIRAILFKYFNKVCFQRTTLVCITKRVKVPLFMLSERLKDLMV